LSLETGPPFGKPDCGSSRRRFSVIGPVLSAPKRVQEVTSTARQRQIADARRVRAILRQVV
jgi:hypothetical protein